jgi:hypothetical protein
MYEIEISAKFDTEAEARAALSDAEEAVGKNDGELLDSWISEENSNDDLREFDPDGEFNYEDKTNAELVWKLTNRELSVSAPWSKEKAIAVLTDADESDGARDNPFAHSIEELEEGSVYQSGALHAVPAVKPDHPIYECWVNDNFESFKKYTDLKDVQEWFMTHVRYFGTHEHINVVKHLSTEYTRKEPGPNYSDH